MSDQLKHECGISLIHLKKPLDFYTQKYGSHMYGVDKMFLMMEKQIHLFLSILRLAVPDKSDKYFDDVGKLILSKSQNKTENESYDVTEFLYPYL